MGFGLWTNHPAQFLHRDFSPLAQLLRKTPAQPPISPYFPAGTKSANTNSMPHSASMFE
jgi:hypothetical protein